MREIKFRGQSLSTRRYVYGYYCETLLHEPMIIDAKWTMHFVKPASVAQLIGRDETGRGVWEKVMVGRKRHAGDKI